jgi:hypothetical protein
VVPSGPTTHQQRHEPGSRAKPSDHRRAMGRHVHRLAAYERSHGRVHHMEPGARAPARGIGRAPGDPHGLPRPNRATWAGSPAGSSPTAPRPSAPSSSPNSSTPPGRRCAKPSPATAWECPPATPPPSASAPSPPPATAAASRPPRPWTRCLLRSILAPSPPTVSGRAVPVGPPRGAVRHLGRQRGGRAVQRESRPPTTTGPRRSSDEPTAATGWPANAPTAPTAATPTEPTESTAPAGPTNPRSGRWWPMSAEPTGPHQRAASGSTLVVYLDVLGS